nr:hypothetical protein Iba_chr03aCG17960 [Ipomoea batatas]
MLKFYNILLSINNFKASIRMKHSNITSVKPSHTPFINLIHLISFHFIIEVARGNTASTNSNFSSGHWLVIYCVTTFFPRNKLDIGTRKWWTNTPDRNIIRLRKSSSSKGFCQTITLSNWSSVKPITTINSNHKTQRSSTTKHETYFSP